MADKKSIVELQHILSRVKYRDWLFYLEARGSTRECPDDYDVVLQVQFSAPDNEKGGDPVLQRGRKWFLSRYSCPTEVIQTAWAAVHRAELHEIQEKFLYRGVSIWNNHVDVEALVIANEKIDQRNKPLVAENYPSLAALWRWAALNHFRIERVHSIDDEDDSDVSFAVCTDGLTKDFPFDTSELVLLKAAYAEFHK